MAKTRRNARSRSARARRHGREQAETARALAEAELLNTIASAAAGEDDLTRMLSTVLDHIRRVVDFSGGSIALVQGDDLIIRAAVGPFADAALGQRLRRGPGRSWRVILEREPFLSGDVVGAGLRPTTPIRSYLAVPLVWQGECFGLLEVDSTEIDAFDADDLALLQRVAVILSGPIELARRYATEVRALEEVEAARRQLEDALRRVNATNRLIALAASALDLGQVFDEFGEVLRTLVPFVRVTVSLYSPETDTLTMPYFKGPKLSAPPEKLEGPKGGTARGWVIDHGEAFIRDDTFEIKQFAEDDVLAGAGIRSYVVVPMTVSGRVIGTLNFGHDAPGIYTGEHARIAQPIADQLGLTISRFQLFEQVARKAGELSATLQRALLPAALPRPPFVTITALYQAADPEARVGGDWYDALLLPDDRLLISLGDVVGHGVAAAASMAQARHLVRALAIQGRRPAEVMAAVNHYLLQVPERTHLSMWIASLDPVTGDMIYGGAGHPPVLVQGENGARDLPSQSPPVGFSAAITYRDERVRLHPGERLVAYTDGLIEATRDPIEGERRLRDAVARARPEPSELTAHALVVDVLGGARQEDDIALLLLDFLPLSAPLSFALPALPDNLRRVRHAIRIYAERTGFPPRRVEEIVAAVGEAALNIVEHAYRGELGEVAVDARIRDGSFVVTVHDAGRWRPMIERGRGLGRRLMEGFADSAETLAGPGGTTVEMRWTLPTERATTDS